MSRRILFSVALMLLTSGCGISEGLTDKWFGKSEPPPLPGERVSVMKAETALQPDPEAQQTPVLVPDAVSNTAWPMAESSAGQAPGNLALAASIQQVWSAGVGAGAGKRARLVVPPVVADGRVYALDTETTLHAVDAQTGRAVWTADLRPKDESDGGHGGGIAVDQGRLVVGTGFAEVISLDPATGQIRWRKSVAAPVRGNPAISGSRVMVPTIDNQLVALSTEDGAPLWTHTGLTEVAGVMGSVSPAVSGDTVVVPYSSGEVYALKIPNGRVAWMDSLASLIGGSALTNLADIRGSPVVDRGFVFAISHSGRMVAIDERIGIRAWSQSIGGVNTPWVGGNTVYVLSSDNQLVALTREEGRIRWVNRLPLWKDPEDREGRILTSGPVMGGGKLWVTTSQGQLLAFNPDTGEKMSEMELPGPASQPPVIANGTLYVLTDNADLVAYR